MAPAGVKSRTILAFDYGQRRIGIAVGDTGTSLASPLKTLLSGPKGPDWQSIQKIIAEWKPDVLVVGVPYNMDGSDSLMTRLAQRFSRQLEGRFGVSVETVDERLTSRDAQAELKHQRRSGLKLRRTTKQDVDKTAARIILETWLARPALS